MSPDQITRNAAAISGAVKMLEREIASFHEQLSASASTDETRRQISDYLTELHFHFRTLCTRAERLENETRELMGTQTAATAS
jgi:predicted acylesterase/phospholipase RssA